MGFDTYVEIGNRIVVQYRKQTGSLPRFLFERVDILISKPDDVVDKLYFERSVKGVRQVLDEQGLGWDATVAAYAGVRDGWVAEAMLSGRYYAEYDGPEETIEARVKYAEAKLAEQRAIEPASDLELLGQLFAAQWQDEAVDNVLMFEHLAYDDALEPTTALLYQALHLADARGDSALPIVRAVQTLVLLFREARLVAWPMLISILIQYLPDNTLVKYELSDGILEFDIDDPDRARVFVDEYWNDTGVGVANYARNIGTLFATLSQFETKLGVQYWFGKADTFLRRLDRLNEDRSSSSTTERGDALELLMEALFKTEGPGLSVTERSFSTREEEIDLLLRNNLADPFWLAQHSPFIFVECKNWQKPVGVAELRVLESKLGDRGDAVRIGIFVSNGGYYKTFTERLKVIQTKNIGIIYAITLDDVRSLIGRRERLSEWLLGDGARKAFDVTPVDS